MALFKIGLPTDLDVKRLRERYPDSKLTPGMSITYAEACAIIGVHSEKDGRFKSVTNARRRNKSSRSAANPKRRSFPLTKPRRQRVPSAVPPSSASWLTARRCPKTSSKGSTFHSGSILP